MFRISALSSAIALGLMMPVALEAAVSFTTHASLPVPAWSAPSFGSGAVIQDEAGNLYGAGVASRDRLNVLYRLSPAGQFSVLHTFPAGTVGPLMKDGTRGFLGTFAGGPGQDVVFRINPAGVYSVVATFDPTKQTAPAGSLVHASDGYYYGVASGGGGVPASVFRMSAIGKIATVASFDASYGTGPLDGLVEGADHALYGVTPVSGADQQGAGRVFRVTPAGALSVVHEFHGSDGRVPSGKLVMTADGSLYGSTSLGGDESLPGTVFRITAAGAFTSAHSSTGYLPSPLTLGIDGKVYGVTRASFSPPGVPGNLFRVEADGTQTRLGQFFDSAASYPNNIATGTDGNFYCLAGSTAEDGIYRVTPAGAVSLAGKFESAYDTNNPASLVFTADGTCYSTRPVGGPTGRGEIFKITPDKVVSPVAALPDSVPNSLMLGADGNLYGTSSAYQTGDRNTVFRLTPAGELTTMVEFQPGLMPSGIPLIQGSGGDLFGISTNSWVFKLTPGGTLTLLQSFDNPVISLVYDALRGYLWGSTLNGSYQPQLPGTGMLFRLNPRAATGAGLSPFFVFTSGTGGQPTLMQAADGTLYGTSNNGGANDSGYLFKFSPDTEPTPAHPRVTTLHDFSPAEGYGPSNLVQGADARLYGLSSGGDYRFGTVFSYSPASGEFRSLHHFGGEGGIPSWLTPGPGGDLFGFTSFRTPLPDGRSDDLDQIFRLHVDSAPSAFQLWLGTRGLTGGAEGDDDHDGLSNLLEYACGTDPHRSSLEPAGQQGAAPAPGVLAIHPGATEDDPARLTYSVRKEAAASGVRVVVQESADLLTWWSIYQSSSPVRLTGDDQLDLLSVDASLGPPYRIPGSYYYRLRVTEP